MPLTLPWPYLFPSPSPCISPEPLTPFAPFNPSLSPDLSVSLLIMLLPWRDFPIPISYPLMSHLVAGEEVYYSETDDELDDRPSPSPRSPQSPQSRYDLHSSHSLSLAVSLLYRCGCRFHLAFCLSVTLSPVLIICSSRKSIVKSCICYYKLLYGTENFQSLSLWHMKDW